MEQVQPERAPNRAGVHPVMKRQYGSVHWATVAFLLIGIVSTGARAQDAPTRAEEVR